MVVSGINVTTLCSPQVQRYFRYEYTAIHTKNSRGEAFYLGWRRRAVINGFPQPSSCPSGSSWAPLSFMQELRHLTDPSYFDPTRPGFIGRLIIQYAVGSPLHDFLLGVVEPHAVSFGYLVATGEVLIGLAVLSGLLFRIACVAGLALNLTFFLSATWTVFPFYFGSDIVFAVGWLTLLLTGPQAAMSVDGVLSRRFTSFNWLISGSSAIPKTETMQPEKPPVPMQTLQVPSKAGLYPKQVREVNSSFNRIKEQFLGNEETQTVLEML